MYAKLEEDHGLARHAMAIYERATKAVLPEEQFEVRFLVHKKYIKATNRLMPLLMLTLWQKIITNLSGVFFYQYEDGSDFKFLSSFSYDNTYV